MDSTKLTDDALKRVAKALGIEEKQAWVGYDSQRSEPEDLWVELPQGRNPGKLVDEIEDEVGALYESYEQDYRETIVFIAYKYGVSRPIAEQVLKTYLNVDAVHSPPSRLS